MNIHEYSWISKNIQISGNRRDFHILFTLFMKFHFHTSDLLKEPLLDFVPAHVGTTEIKDLVFFPMHINVILLHRKTFFLLPTEQ